MRLTELDPRWIHPNVFAFLCPHCRKFYLICKNVEMKKSEQYELFEKEFGPDWNERVVPAKPEMAWTITGTVPPGNAAFIQDCTVTPSIDASASGHWHGFITAGEIK